MEQIFKRSKIAKVASYEAYQWLQNWIKERHPAGGYPPPVKEYFYRNIAHRQYLSKFLENVIIKVLKEKGANPIKAKDRGRWRDDSKLFTDVTGRKRVIGSGHFEKDQDVSKGRADVICFFHGAKGMNLYNFEVKVGADRQSPDQLKEQARAEANGEVYAIIKTVDDFIKYL
jgi:hypothetical protein